MIGPQMLSDELGEWDGDQSYTLEGPGGPKTMASIEGRFLLFTVRFYVDAFREEYLKAFFEEVGKDKQ